MSVLAVALQIVGAVAAIAAAGLYFESVWASVFVLAVVMFAAGEALERR